MNLKNKLDEMVSKEWLYSPTRKNLIINSWSMQDDDTITLHTSDGQYTCPFGNHDEWLKNFLPVDNEQETKTISLTQLDVPENSVFAGDTMGRLRNILMENIETLRGNKDYIPQAQAINDNAKALIDMAKTEVELYKAVASLKK